LDDEFHGCCFRLARRSARIISGFMPAQLLR
jgi:hypothetical protein